MERFRLAVLVTIYATLASAAELPARKAGLWEVTMSLPGRTGPGQVIQQCIDATTDQMMQSSAGPLSPGACPKREVQNSANGFTIDSACGRHGELRGQLYDDGDGAQRRAAGRQHDHGDGRAMARPLQGRAKTRRHDFCQRHAVEYS
jgi:hypothetical protein